MSDLTPAEQVNVRTAIRYLRLKVGTWAPLAKVLRLEEDTLSKVVTGRRGVSASVAIRVAKFLNAPVDDVMAGRFLPAGTCRFCGHPPDDRQDSAGKDDGNFAAPTESK